MKHDKRTIAIVFDDHDLFADAFSALLQRVEIFNTVYTFNEEAELLHFLIKHPQETPYLFLDFYLKDNNVLPLVKEIKRLSKKAIIVVVSAVVNPIAITHILAQNPQGLISKSSGFDTILEALMTIERGEQYICPIISKVFANSNQPFEMPFTIREVEILQYFARGLSIAQTAVQANLSKHTIVGHRRKMMAKIHVNSITELLAYARKLELVR